MILLENYVRPSIVDIEGCDCTSCQVAQESWEDDNPFSEYDSDEFLDIDPDKILVTVDACGVTLSGVDIITRYRPYNMKEGFVYGGWMKLSNVSEELQ
tara:strand:+ start:261 stop:554 length:294 start_codon:yes stop_codon:yes gene_type:complete